jgi:hypothetical protein
MIQMIVWNKSREDLYALKIIQRGTKNEPALPNDTCTIFFEQNTQKSYFQLPAKRPSNFFFRTKKDQAIEGTKSSQRD